MPLRFTDEFSAPWLFANAHAQTILPTLLRKVRGVAYQRERIETPDEDFLDLDWSRVGSKKLAILSHGLEGDSRRHYILGMVKHLNHGGYDALAWNFRGCSGEPNRKLRFYHSGETQDLHTVITHAGETKQYDEIVLVGFSLGGNMTLKYLGEKRQIPTLIKKAVSLSVPCDLRSSAEAMEKTSNLLYMKRFLLMFREKIKAKQPLFPDALKLDGFDRLKSFKDFDDRYTAPLHGFKNAQDYWEQCSCKPFIPNVKIPTLLLMAKDDPFLAAACYPLEEARENPQLFLEITAHGGHMGFMAGKGRYWSESRTLAFLAT